MGRMIAAVLRHNREAVIDKMLTCNILAWKERKVISIPDTETHTIFVSLYKAKSAKCDCVK